VNNPTLTKFCFSIIKKANIKKLKNNIAINAWLLQASYPYNNFSSTSSFKF
ncbi:uncharacterized protein K460DRAFT_297739, partial [Cucurbitaria berberidis CBS 394.84]